MAVVRIENNKVTLEDIIDIVHRDAKLELSNQNDYIESINENAHFLKKMIQGAVPIYGTTTGFGASCVEYLSVDNAKTLQKNLVKYHMCGTGEYFSDEQTLAFMIARLVSLSKGYSGVRYCLLENLTNMINHKITPLVPMEGSVGASGDLTPLAYIAAGLEGVGKVHYKGEILVAKEALKRCDISPLEFEPKEALAIMNGTSVMTGVLALEIDNMFKLCRVMEYLTSMVIQALHGQNEAFHKNIHNLKPFEGQKESAKNIDNLLSESKLLRNYKEQSSDYFNAENKSKKSTRLPFKVQDVYSLRCSPHVIGVVRDTLRVAMTWMETELNAVTDNPLIFDKDETVLLGGNFYGGYIGHACDYLKIAISNLADLSDRQLALIVDEKFSGGLPSNLVMPDKIGLNHGFKGLQITASALAAEVLRNATPASIFSRVTESCNQDKVSMGTIASRDLARSVKLVSKILAIQALAAAQALDIRGIGHASPAIMPFYEKIRNISAPLLEDRPMDRDVERVASMILA